MAVDAVAKSRPMSENGQMQAMSLTQQHTALGDEKLDMAVRVLAEPIEFGGPILIFGGPYGNLPAMLALLDAARRLSIAPEQMVCTGDVVAYCADPVATVDTIRAACIRVVQGNCEESLATGALDCGCGFAPDSACDRLSSAWFAHADAALDADTRRWMGSLPRRLDIRLGGQRLAVVHGGTASINRFVFASTRSEAKREELERAAVEGIIGGHCGLPFTQTVDGFLWHNAGAIGLPANDGTPRGWFSVLTPGDEGLRIEHHALAYDHATAAASMRRAGLPEGYAAALETGLWPSCDVLPAKEIRQRGVAIRPGGALWKGRREAPRRKTAPVLNDLWPSVRRSDANSGKFTDPLRTAAGEERASVALDGLETLWFNTGTLCNIACENCYIESSPRNDRLVYITRDEVAVYLDEIEKDGLPTAQIGFTGGEPFMNRDMPAMLEECLSRGYRTLVLTNAMRPMARRKQALLQLKERAGSRLAIRVSLDHYTPQRHEEERGPGTFQPTLDGLVWLARHGFDVSVAGRTMWGEDLDAERQGYARLFAEHRISIDARDPARLVLFPEMDAQADVPEISSGCWRVLGKLPQDVMCASSRMVVKRKGAAQPCVVACTLLPYDSRFELGRTLAEASGPVQLNHPHCARFCVLGQASCSA